MEEVFGSKYASYYDALYADKDYRVESERISRIIKNHSLQASSILELGCGTGNHTILLGQTYRMTSVERSPYMLELARRKMGSTSIEFIQSDVTTLPNFARKFDVCISMFHVLNYLRSPKEIKSVLNRVNDLLEDSGILLFDSWNGLAVLKERPSIRVKEVRSGKLRVIRVVTPTLDVFENVCENSYHIMVMDGKNLVDEYDEKHLITYLFPREVKNLLDECNFELLGITTDNGDPLSDSDWSMQIVARKQQR